MARFYGEMTGNRGTATREGTKESGFVAHIRGWNIGVQVDISVNSEGKDEVTVWLTGGSNGAIERKLMFRETEKEAK